DPIASLNKKIAFIGTTFASRYPLTNNQLKTSSNPRNQATIQHGRVTVKKVQGKQSHGYARSGSRVNSTGINRSVGLNTTNQVKALKSGAVLKEEHMDFLADNGNAVTTSQGSQEVTTPICFQTNNLDAFDSNCDEAPSASAILMAKLFAYHSDVLSEVPSHDNYLNNDMFENNVQELQYSEQPPFIDDFNIESTSDSNVISYDQHLKEYENEVVQERDADKSRNGDDSHDTVTGVRRQALVARECTYPDFMKCQPLNFKGSEGVVELTQWFERMEIVFRISNCTMENQIKFATFTLRGSAITLGEIKNLEIKVWNLKVKGTDVVSYNQRFQELALMYDRMFLEESDKIEKYVGGLPDMIHGSVMASKPKTMQDAIEFATELIDKKISTLAESQVENKRKLDNNNQAQQQPPKKQSVCIAYTVRPG
ncbi:hypothetical protein Tco_1236048, partial [Tanacetum coccineum]